MGSRSPQGRIQTPHAPLPPLKQAGEEACREGRGDSVRPPPSESPALGSNGIPASGFGAWGEARRGLGTLN